MANYAQNMTIRRMARPYECALGVLLPVRYEVSWEVPRYGLFRVETGSRGGKRYTILIHPSIMGKPATLRRTLAHEVYHAWEEQEGFKTSERAAEHWARKVTGGL